MRQLNFFSLYTCIVSSFGACLGASIILSPAAFAGESTFHPVANLLGGFDAGYANMQAQQGSALNKDGPLLNLKAIGSFKLNSTSPYLLDLGLGWFSTVLQGANRSRLERNFLNAGFVELSPRYRLGDSWQLGPYIDLAFGTDLSLALTPSKNSSLGFMPGLQALYEFHSGSVPLRTGLRAGTDLSLDSKHLYTAQFSFQIGYPEPKLPIEVAQSLPAPVARDVPVAPTLSAISLKEPGVEVHASGNNVFVSLDRGITQFPTGSAKLGKKAVQYLNKLSDFLNQNPTLWKSVEVTGHTDSRGSLKINGPLSKARAQSVGNVFLTQGLEKDRLKVMGVASRKPIDPKNNPLAWAKNRRVEIHFIGVTDPERLSGVFQDTAASGT